VGPVAGHSPGVDEANKALWHRWQLADAGLELRDLPRRGVVELRTDQVFLDPAIAGPATSALPGAQGVLTYFVNELRVGDRATPYSTVAAMPEILPAGGSVGSGGSVGTVGSAGGAGAGERPRPSAPAAPGVSSPIPAGMGDGEIAINQ